MPPGKIIVVSGRVASGKSELATRLSNDYGAILVKTRDLIVALRPSTQPERLPLQKAGEHLDRLNGGQWVADQLARYVNDRPTQEDSSDVLVVDAVRIKGQIDHIRRTFGNGSRVIHVHLTASHDELARRYARRKPRSGEAERYENLAAQSATERNVERLAKVADLVVHTDRCTPGDVLVRVAAAIGLHPRDCIPTVDVVVGGQYGSEGKGNIVSYLAKEYDLLVRVGGPNAGHKVFLEPIHTFHHLPSGTLHNPNAKLVLGPGAQLRVPKLLEEIAECQLDYRRLSIDPQATIIEDEDVQFEAGDLKSRISSTGQGVGAAIARRIRMRGNEVRLARNIPELKPYIRSTSEVLADAYGEGKKILLEGTQGTSLSLYHGYYPYVTSRDTTAAGCLAESGISVRRVRKIIMVCRTYPIRVGKPKRGTSGPMLQEISLKEIAGRSGIDLTELRKNERTSTTNKKRRIGEFDWNQLRLSTQLNSPTDIALTFADYLSVNNRDARRYEQLQPETIQFVEEVERVSGVPVTLINTRFHWRSVIDRRNW